MRRLDRANVGLYRVTLKWSGVESKRGRYDWAYYDRLFLRASRSNVRLLPVLLGSPAWAARREPYPPTTSANKRAFYRFAAAAADRYGPTGGFWAGKSFGRSVRAHYWQIWNEPDLPKYWNQTVSPSGYGRFLKATASALNSADSTIQVVSAGLTRDCKNRVGCTTRFLDKMLDDPRVGRAIDVFALHTYTTDWRNALPERLAKARRVLDRHSSSRGKRMIITEFGWSSGGPPSKYRVSRSEQARRLEYVYRQLLRVRRKYRLMGAVWFGYRDPGHKAGKRDFWARHTGVFDSRNRAKPAWSSLLEITGGRR